MVTASRLRIYISTIEIAHRFRSNPHIIVIKIIGLTNEILPRTILVEVNVAIRKIRTGEWDTKGTPHIVKDMRAFLQLVLEDAGLTMDDVVKCNVYLTDMANFAAMNQAYKTRFTAPYPARTTVAVAGLPLGAQVEIELVARRPD